MTDNWSIGLVVRIRDCLSRGEGSIPSWTAKNKKFFFPILWKKSCIFGYIGVFDGQEVFEMMMIGYK